MKFELTTISTKKFLLITLLSIPLILFLSIGLAILTKIQGLVFLIVPLSGLIIYLGHRLSRTKTEIDLSEINEIKINGEKIQYKNIIGYFINDTGLTLKAICLRLDTKRTIQIMGFSVGEQGKKFLEAQKKIINMLKSQNKHLLELEYQDVYVRQINILRPILYVLTGIVIIVDISALYFLLIDKIELPWQIFIINFVFVGLIPYMKKRKTTNANNRLLPAGLLALLTAFS